MKNLLFVLLLVPAMALAAETPDSATADPSAGGFDARAAERFAKLALACVHKEYPNKISHVLNSDADVAPPRKLTPAFCGCYDWHSSVHGHWLLVRLVRTFRDAPFAAAARDALKKSLTAENCEADVMRRVLPQSEFAKWFKEFMPQIPTTANADWLPVAISPDPSDPKLAHLDGLNLSRAWMLEGILSALPSDDPRRPALQARRM